MAVADLNGDRIPDLIIPIAAGTVVLLGSGGGHFAPPILASSSAGSFVAVADLNGDKNQDLILSGNPCCYNSISVLLGDGHGGFDAPLSQPSLGPIQPRIALGDFNRDGKVDLAAVSPNGLPGLLVSFGNGDGTFAPATSFALPTSSPSGVAVASADLNADGLPDLAVIAYSNPSSALVPFYNQGKGTFVSSGSYPIATSNFVALANLNADSYPDALVANNGQGTAVSVLLNNGHGAFIDGELISTSSPQFVVTGDFNGDGKLDLATVNNVAGLTVFLNTGVNKSLFNPLPSLPYYSGPLVAGDFNNDHHGDLVFLNNTSGETLLGVGDGSFTLVPGSFTTGSLYGIPAAVAADMNGDGKLDIVTSVGSINLGNGDGTFRAPLTLPNYCFTGNVAVADVNRDGRPDVIISCQGVLSVYLGNGDGTISYPVFSDFPTGLQSFAVGDFNHDGLPDIAFTSQPTYFLPASTEVTILLGQGNGSFSSGVSVPVLTGTTGLIIPGEFDGSGHLDLAVLDNTDSVVSILRGNGDGTFQLPQLFGAGANSTCLVDGRFRASSQPGEQDVAFCSGSGIALDLNTTK